jgi:protein SCO1/2
MKHLKSILIIVVLTMSFSACNSKKSDKDLAVYQCPMHCEGDKTYREKGSCPVCKMDLQLVGSTTKELSDTGISDESIFNLTSKWYTEENEEIELKDLKGKTLVMVMIYTSCKAACPRLVADMRNIETKIPKENLKDLRFVLVSIDPRRLV